MSRYQGELRIGTSGYHYDHWKGVFYPEDLPKTEWFSYYARQFDTVEINNTFYRLPEATTFEAWRRQAPKGFCYALKFSRYGSHIVRLKKPRDTIGKFLKRADRLGEFLGPILVQLPPNWKADPERLAAFLKAAPNDYRWAVEFRDRSLALRGGVCDSQPARFRALHSRHDRRSSAAGYRWLGLPALSRRAL